MNCSFLVNAWRSCRPVALLRTLVLFAGLNLAVPTQAGDARPLFVSAPQTLALASGSKPAPNLRARLVQASGEAFGSDAATQWFPGARFQLNLFEDYAPEIVVIRTASSGPEQWLITGQLVGQPASHVLLAVNGAAISGSVFAPGVGNFKIESTPGGNLRVLQLDPLLAGRCAVCGEVGVDHAVDPAAGGGGRALSKLSIGPVEPPVGGTNKVAIVDVMVVYTSAARLGAGGLDGMNSLIDLSMAEANTVYQNSRASVRLRLVYRGEVNYTESANLSTNLNRLVDTTDGFMDDVPLLRQTNKADVVCLITESADSGFAGLAKTMYAPASTAFAPFAYSVVQRSQAFGTLTFVHEISHNLGCAHDREHAEVDDKSNPRPGAYSYSFGYRFQIGTNTYRTVMAYEPGIQLPYLSNPDVLFQGVPLGIAGGLTNEANNAKTVSLNGPIVSAFFPPAVLTQLPVVTQTFPPAGSTFTAGGNIQFTVSANDPDGTIKQIEAYADDLFIGAGTSGNFGVTWTNVPAGEYAITMRAVDNLGASSAVLPYQIIVHPQNDNFTNGVVLTGTALDFDGSNRAATTETGEPGATVQRAGRSVWYRWVAPKSGTVNFDVVGSGFIPYPLAYRGAVVTNLTLPGGFKTSFSTSSALSSFDVVKGTNYTLLVDGVVAVGSANFGTFHGKLRYLEAPLNDDFANREKLTNDTVEVRANNLFATTETGEPPQPSGNPGGKSVWYEWTAPRAGSVTVTAVTTNFIALLDVYTGTSVSLLTMVPGRTVDFDNQSFATTLRFEAVKGTVYKMPVAGFQANSGWFTLNLNLPPNPPNDDFANGLEVFGKAWTVAGNNNFSSREPGEPLISGNPGGRSLWYTWTAPTRGHVLISASSTNFTTLVGAYQGSALANLTIPSGLKTVFDSTNHLTSVDFDVVSNVTYHIAVDGFQKGTGDFSLDAVLFGPPANDDFSLRQGLAGTNWTVAADNTFATMESGEPVDPINPVGKSVWYTWTAPYNGSVTIVGAGTNFFAVPEVYNGTNLLGLLIPPARSIAFNLAAKLVTCKFDVTAGQVFQLAFRGFNSDGGPFTATMSMTLLIPPLNDNFANRISLASVTNVVVGFDNGLATTEPGDPATYDGSNLGGHSIWYSWTAPVTGPVTLVGSSATIFSLVDVFTGDSLTNLVSAGNTADFGSGPPKTVTAKFTAHYGVMYQIVVAGFGSSSGVGTLSLTAKYGPPALQTNSGVGNPPGGIYGFSVKGSAGSSFVTYASTNLINWSPVATNLFATNLFNYIETNAFPRRFYYIQPAP